MCFNNVINVLIRKILFVNVALGKFPCPLLFSNGNYLAKHEWKSTFLLLGYLYNNVYSQ